MNYFQLLQAIACICTIANFGCYFYGINTKDAGKLFKPNVTVQTELIAKR
jgi:hypothetical protein